MTGGQREIIQLPSHAIPRYQTTYRADETELILRLTRRGESLGFVGLAGVGKSNIVNFLRDIHHNAVQNRPDLEHLYFPVIDAPHWSGSPASLWKLMWEALSQAIQRLSPPPLDPKVIPISEEERALSMVQERLNWACQTAGCQVMFILDDFDTVLETGPLSMLERLNGLRSEGNREALSYLIFTKRLPHILGQSYDLDHKSKFYDLFRRNIYALEPYTEEDAMQMLRHLNDLAGQPLLDGQLQQIYQLAGGHAGLLKIVFNIWIEEGASGVKTSYFAGKPDVQQECQRILSNLHEPEQEVARLIAQDQHTAEHQDVMDHLVRRGLLLKQDPPTWFSPLFAHFLNSST